MMKQLLRTMLFLLGATIISAQSTSKSSLDSAQIAEYRAKIALDYTMPDYSIHKIDPKVMGPRLAAILQELSAKYKQGNYFSMLSSIQSDQIEGLDYCTIEKMGLVDVTKTGNTITIRFKTTLAKNPLDIKKSDLILTFVDGVSDKKNINDLFVNISNYLK